MRIAIMLFLWPVVWLQAQPPPPMVGLGDSLGEGVQSADASRRTQPYGYLPLFARQMGVSFPLPLIQSGPFGFVGVTSNRSRVNPDLEASNLAVSGADSASILNDRAGPPIDSETDLVLSPRLGSQIEIAEALGSPFMICWIGNNDVLGAVLDFNHLDAAPMTPAAEFAANYAEIVTRLNALGGRVVAANIPNVDNLAFLVSRNDLIRFLGQDYGLPAGSYTSVPAMLLIMLGLSDGSLIQDPDFVLDPQEAQQIQDRVQQLNGIIATQAAQAGIPVVDVNNLFEALSNNPPVIGGITITNRFLGGMFSLDGVHPSNIGHAVLANAFIRKTNQFYGTGIPPMSGAELLQMTQADPFVDLDGDLAVRGRPFAGLLETLGPLIGISGDDETAARTPGTHRGRGVEFMRQYLLRKGRDPGAGWDFHDAVEAMREIFGMNLWVRNRNN
jgi:lysophospholipase L1-like esterase